MQVSAMQGPGSAGLDRVDALNRARLEPLALHDPEPGRLDQGQLAPGEVLAGRAYRGALGASRRAPLRGWVWCTATARTARCRRKRRRTAGARRLLRGSPPRGRGPRRAAWRWPALRG